MNQRHLLSSALASVVALGLASPAAAHMEGGMKGKEKCYGVAKAGENSCSNLAGTHACAGEAPSDNLPDEWKLVPKGSCAKMGGMSEKQATAAFAKTKAKSEASPKGVKGAKGEQAPPPAEGASTAK